MVPFIRSLCITICAAIYPLIPKLFNIFYMLAAKPTFFQTERIQTLINNIYVLVSVVMLFALAVKAISSIVNPDNLWDSKKGVSGVLKRSVIALVLIVAIPFMFQYFYQFQTKIVSENLIEKLILGIDVENSTTDANGNEQANNLQTQYKIGETLAAQAIQATLHPAPDVDGNIGKCVDGTSGAGISASNMATSFFGQFPIFSSLTTANSLRDAVTSGASELVVGSLCKNYNAVIGLDIDNIKNMVFSINSTTNTWVGVTKTLSNAHYVLEFEGFGLFSVAVGAIIVYFLIIFCIDSALRLIKLGFLELTAPMSIMAYIAGGNDVLKKWFNEVLSTLISLFLRIAAIAFLALVLEELPNFVKNLPNEYGNIIKLFIIIGSLIFVKKVPELIEKITGMKLSMAGGISGRLGQMAGVGKVAQNAWKSLASPVKKLGGFAKGVGSTAAGFALGAAGIGAKEGLKFADNKFLSGEGQNLLDSLKNNDKVQTAGALGSIFKSGVSAGGGKKSRDTVIKGFKDNEILKENKAKKQREKASTWLNANDGEGKQFDSFGRSTELMNPLNKISFGDSSEEKLRKQNNNERIASNNIKDRVNYRHTMKTTDDTRLKGDEYSKELRHKEAAERVLANKNEIAKILRDSRENTNNYNLREDLNRLAAGVEKDNISASKLMADIARLSGPGGPILDGTELKKKINQGVSLALDADIMASLKHLGYNTGDKLTTKALGKFVSNAENITVANAKDEYEKSLKKDNIMSEEDKTVYTKYIEEKEKTTYGEYLNQVQNRIENGKFVGPMPSNTQSTSQPATQPGPQPMPNTQAQPVQPGVQSAPQSGTQSTPNIQDFNNGLREEGIEPGTQEYFRALQDSIFRNGPTTPNMNDGNQLGNQNISSQNVTVNANTAEVHSNTTNVYGNNTVNRDNFNNNENEERTSRINEQTTTKSNDDNKDFEDLQKTMDELLNVETQRKEQDRRNAQRQEDIMKDQTKKMEENNKE